MSEIKNGGPAFPGKASINRSTGELQAHQFGNNDFETLGMSLRDYFAAKALQGLLADPSTNTAINSTDRDFIEREQQKFADLAARVAYRMADAMLRARGEA